jgi:membrane-bound metal-dependent hydrolase YbcI (DUF457 family)
MDTITHGIAGALIGKALCGGEDMFPARPVTRARVVTWAFMFGAIFPDIDVVRDMLSRNDLLMITWHRSYTHSLLMLPLMALGLAWLARFLARRFAWESPGFSALAGIFGAGILSHILLDLVTTFGTMVWSPLNWSRPAWDLVFIVDFTLSAILLLPQLLAWAHRGAAKARVRSILVWLLAVVATFSVGAIGKLLGAPISATAVAVAIAIFSALCLIPAFRGAEFRPSPVAWNRIGLAVSCVYVVLTIVAHHQALQRVEKFAAFQGAQVQAIGALPFPPSLLNWDGLVRTPRGVYEMRIDLSQPSGIPDSSAVSADPPAGTNDPPFTYKYFPDAPSNKLIQIARQLPEVQKVLWFDRFPVTRFRKEGAESVVEILDMRFPQIRPDRPASFTYRVRFDAAGAVISQGWVRN